MKTVVFIPSDLEKPKQVNSAVYTENLVAVNGNYDDVNRLASEIAGEEDDWAFVNVNVRPFYAEGSKTLGYEIPYWTTWHAHREQIEVGCSRARTVFELGTYNDISIQQVWLSHYGDWLHGMILVQNCRLCENSSR